MEVCPMCGFTEPTRNKPQRNVMNQYVTEAGKADCVLNDDAEELTLSPKGKTPYKVIRADVFAARQAAKAAPKVAAPVASKPSTPTPTAPVAAPKEVPLATQVPVSSVNPAPQQP